MTQGDQSERTPDARTWFFDHALGDHRDHALAKETRTLFVCKCGESRGSEESFLSHLAVMEDV